MTTIDEDRDEVRRLLLLSGAQRRDGDPDATAANASTAEMESIAQRHEAEGRLLELLSPLLSDGEDQEVRFGAATFLLGHAHADSALPVLESLDLAKARIVLSYWRRQQQGTA